MKPICTKGNIEVEKIKIGDIHYDFQGKFIREVRVLSLPKRDDTGFWSWESIGVKNEEVYQYSVNESLPQEGPNLYDYIAYEGCVAT